ncbi:STM4504/CBY_0614 family protein [Sphingomonas rubra]|uniref:Abortive infection C-terminus n=1 Tax=Sphingomonas rubra TaxID=634430 RepID=A0A1I5S6L5_9SPHN|nr:hypothetical protein [Sphingomonas rubra]SFP66334.1 hypothetical protein SAMN04488241_1053 [Sphingomonas rubra]
MTLPATFSRRRRQAAASTGADVYQYDDFPPKLRRQIVMILLDAIGGYHAGSQYTYLPRVAYDAIVAFCRKEQGVHVLTRGAGNDLSREFLTWIEEEDRIDDLLDGLEFALGIVDRWVRQNYANARAYVNSSPDDALAEFNARLAEAGVGYAYNEGEIMRVDSALIHKDAVVPVLKLLGQGRFATVDEEYRRAHEAYRHNDYETALTECAKAFESTLKVIAAEHGWAVQPNDTAQTLITVCVNNGLFATYLGQGFGSLRSMLESAIPTIRNKSAAHGAGTTPRVIPTHLATLQIHQTAVVIKFLVEASDAYVAPSGSLKAAASF